MIDIRDAAGNPLAKGDKNEIPGTICPFRGLPLLDPRTGVPGGYASMCCNKACQLYVDLGPQIPGGSGCVFRASFYLKVLQIKGQLGGVTPNPAAYAPPPPVTEPSKES